MYVGITRARATLAVSTLRRLKARPPAAGPALPSRFIAEMKLNETRHRAIRAPS